jgi:putative sigma-54 modulation protein
VEVRVHGKRMHVGNDLAGLAEQKVGAAGRIFGHDAAVDVEFSEQQNPRAAAERFRVELMTRVAGRDVRVEAASPDPRSALDAATDKFERRLRKLKEKLIDRGREPVQKHLNEQAERADITGDEEIVRVKQFAIKPMMPEEAALQMDMLGHNFFFFLNGENDRYGVLYRRRDGSLGLIEPS